MTDRPYTDEDLRTEAARQHQLHIVHSNPRLLLGRMLDGPIESTRSDDDALTWDEALNCEQLNEPKNAIADLIRGAADTSRWAVDLGADGLQPDGHTLQLGAKEAGDDDSEQPFVRMHFAFHPTATDAERDRFVMELSKVIVRNL